MISFDRLNLILLINQTTVFRNESKEIYSQSFCVSLVVWSFFNSLTCHKFEWTIVFLNGRIKFLFWNEMTLAELIHKRIHLSSPSKEKQQNRVQQTQLNEKETNQNKFQRIQTSLLNIFPNFRPAENERKLSVTIQRTNSSIIKSSAIRRTNSKKTVTFASVFDLVNNNENLEHFGVRNLRWILFQPMSFIWFSTFRTRTSDFLKNMKKTWS